MAIKLGYQSCSWFWWPDEFTVFQTLEEIRMAGFTAVEFNEDLKRLGTPEGIARDLTVLGMQCTGLCSLEWMGPRPLVTDAKNRIVFGSKIGVKVTPISLGWRDTGDLPNDAAYRALAKTAEELAAEAAKYDMRLALAPRFGTYFENSRDLEGILPYLKNVNLCADMVNLAASGDDPVEFVRRYADRIAYARIGDWRIHKTVPLGTGYPLRKHQTWSGTVSTEVIGEAPVIPTMDIPRFLAALEEIRYDGCVVVTQGTTDPEHTPLKAAQISREYLRQIGY
jgi:sugar phosphate isomerase/epimerase